MAINMFGGTIMSNKEVYGLEHFCDELEHLISQNIEMKAFLPAAESILKKLLSNKQFICQTMERFITDDDYVKVRMGTIDAHDLGLYLSPQKIFSMRLFVWLPGEHYPVHDHGAWGVVGGFANQTQQIKYRRLDDGTVQDYAELEEIGRMVLNPGDTTHVLPYSVHHMSSLNNITSLTLHVYGKPVRKGFINCFNCTENSTYRLPTPKLNKRIHAIRALAAIGGEEVVEPLEKAFQDVQPLIRLTAIEAMKTINNECYVDLLHKALSDPDDEIRVIAKRMLSET